MGVHPGSGEAPRMVFVLPRSQTHSLQPLDCSGELGASCCLAGFQPRLLLSFYRDCQHLKYINVWAVRWNRYTAAIGSDDPTIPTFFHAAKNLCRAIHI